MKPLFILWYAPTGDYWERGIAVSVRSIISTESSLYRENFCIGWVLGGVFTSWAILGWPNLICIIWDSPYLIGGAVILYLQNRKHQILSECPTLQFYHQEHCVTYTTVFGSIIILYTVCMYNILYTYFNIHTHIYLLFKISTPRDGKQFLVTHDPS